jgi:exo-1,4-beta-D-glucosaminidase
LSSLPQHKLDVEYRFREGSDYREITVTQKNAGERIAFFVEMSVSDEKTGRTILLVFWQDNYVSLVPSEKRTVNALFAASDDRPVLTVSEWNMEHR